tara:strand:- start:3264 stop:3818 length:555 start_codon:yes stop_codon:yes gene_type:complete
MLEDIFKGLSAASGIETITDFGAIYNRDQGPNLVTIKLSIEQYKSYFYLRISITYSRGMSKKTRVIKWPYSETEANDLTLVIEDIKKVVQAKDHPELNLSDNRTGIGRWFDSLTGRKYYGYFEFTSPGRLTEDISVTAEITDSGKDTLVSLTERKKGHSFILSHPPHDAFEVILSTLEKFMSEN